MASVLSLPIPLVLLVHLHILEYPHANKPEYDHDIFNPRVRGLRDRIKTLEDVCYFLVGRTEGNSRTIFPTYPCLQPSDTIAFRTSLAKYIESLRHQSLYPGSKVSTGTSGKSSANPDGRSLGWWWKDVVVRKSLLEECSGERFERILLSLSTHALLKGITPTAVVLPENIDSALRNQPIYYTERLARYKSARRAWLYSASLLLQRQAVLSSLRDRLILRDSLISSQYSPFTTERLVALAKSKRQDLLHIWGNEGRLALDFLTRLSGLNWNTPNNIQHTSQVDTTCPSIEIKHITAPPQPLPIAAAHHPATLKKIRKSIFTSTMPKTRDTRLTDEAESPKAAESGHTGMPTLSDHLDAESMTHRALAKALDRIHAAGKELVTRVGALESKIAGNPSSNMNLWEQKQKSHYTINFDTRPTQELLSDLSLHISERDGELEALIDDIRESVLPAYPDIPDLHAVRTPLQDAGTKVTQVPSKIPRANQDFLNVPINNTSTSHSHGSEFHPQKPVASAPPATAYQKSYHNPMTNKHDIRRGSKVPQKSIRSSLAVSQRPSLFGAKNDFDEEDELENEIHRIVRGTEDDSMEEPRPPVTPKAKTASVKRIFTGTRASTIKRPKQSYPMAFHEPPVALPSLISASSSFNDFLTGTGDENDDWTSADNDKSQNTDDESSYQNEAPSMTLRDILLRADTTQFDLLVDSDGHEDLKDESFGWD